MVNEKGLMPHATHGSVSDADSEEWVFVDEGHVEELLRLQRRILELLLLVFGPDALDREDTETCFGETP